MGQRRNPIKKQPEQSTQNTQTEQPKAAIGKKKRSCIIYSRYIWEVLLKCVAFIGLPYLYLIVCGIIHDNLVRTGSITLAQREAFVVFVFFSLMAFWLVGAVLSVCCIVTYAKKKRRPAKVKSGKE